MQVPAILYGEIKDVHKRCKEALLQWLLGTPYIAAMEAGGVYDVADVPTPITLEIWRHDAGRGLYLSMPTHVLIGEDGLLRQRRWGFDRYDPRVVTFFDAALTRPWSLLSLLATQDAHILFGSVDERLIERYRRYIAAVLRDCDELEAVGQRYGRHIQDAQYLAQTAYKVYQGLRELGHPTERLGNLLGHRYQGAPEPAGGLRGVLAALGVSIDPALAPERLPDQPTVLPVPPPPPARPPIDPSVFWMSHEMEQALEANDPEAVKRLVAAGEPPDRINGDMSTAFSWAIRHGYTDLVIFLLDHGASVEERGPEGESPLMEAAFHGHIDIVRLLLKRGAKVRYHTDKGEDARSYASMGGQPEIEALLLEAWKGGARRRRAVSGD